ncbi:hypothetical protein WJX82_001415 [Trebouxia sp. C0006]
MCAVLTLQPQLGASTHKDRIPTLLARITNFWQLERKAEAVEQQDIAAAQAYSLEAEEARATERAAKQVQTPSVTSASGALWIYPLHRHIGNDDDRA